MVLLYNRLVVASMSLQKEDQSLQIENDGCLKTTFETTTLPVFWIKVMTKYLEIATTSLKSCCHFRHLICVVFCGDSHQNKTKK